MKPYRDCVVAVIVNDKGEVFAGERSDKPGIWQLPQGGVDSGESAKIALLRELKEELGCNEVEILNHHPDRISYDFPNEMYAPIAKKYSGQIQDWFLLKFKDGAKVDLSQSDGEFRDVAWKKPFDLLSGIVEWKREAYQLGLTAFNLI